jgi:hypothetical protein
VLYVSVRKAHNLVHKPWYKGGFLKSTAQLTVRVAEQEKKSALQHGSQPVFSDTLEFILGEKGPYFAGPSFPLVKARGEDIASSQLAFSSTKPA